MDRSNVEVIYMIFAKVFDKFDQKLICRKLRTLGIYQKLPKWLHDFQKDIIQAVAVEVALSKVRLISSGVQQGTVLGLL